MRAEKQVAGIAIAAAAAIAILYWVGTVRVEPFATRNAVIDPCGTHTDCATCSAAGACGWCATTQRCLAMGLRGYPLDGKCPPDQWQTYPNRCASSPS
jgi:hypothetical protein